MFRTVWSESIGGGHLVRCVVLADELARRGWSICFAGDASEHMPIPGGILYPIIDMNCRERDEPDFLRQAEPNGVDLLIVDHMRRDLTFEQSCRSWARRILAIDGLGRPHDCDILLDPVSTGLESRSAQNAPATCVKLLGPKFALLRPEFARLRQESLDRRCGTNHLGQILVCMGAFDPHGLTELALRGIAIARLDAKTRIILGGSDNRANQLRVLAKELDLEVQVEGWAADMAGALVESDIAIGNAGSASWERCCLGVPSVAIVMADNQQAVAELLSKAGAAIVTGDWRDTAPEDVAAALKSLWEQAAYRNQVIESASALCDGAGVDHVASQIVRLLAETVESTTTNVR